MTVNQDILDTDYLNADPFQGDESELTCRTVKLRTARKEHVCYSLTGVQDHSIQPGERYREERALVDGSFWGKYRLCFRCLDSWIKDFEGDDDGT